jgi:hypothetical protein
MKTISVIVLLLALVFFVSADAVTLSPDEWNNMQAAGVNQQDVKDLISDANAGNIYQNDDSSPHSNSVKAVNTILGQLQNKLNTNFQVQLDSLEGAVAALALAQQKEKDAKAWWDECQVRYDQMVKQLQDAEVVLAKARADYLEAVRLREAAELAYKNAIQARETFEKNMKAEEDLVRTIHNSMVDLNNVRQ